MLLIEARLDILIWSKKKIVGVELAVVLKRPFFVLEVVWMLYPGVY